MAHTFSESILRSMRWNDLILCNTQISYFVLVCFEIINFICPSKVVIIYFDFSMAITLTLLLTPLLNSSGAMAPLA